MTGTDPRIGGAHIPPILGILRAERHSVLAGAMAAQGVLVLLCKEALDPTDQECACRREPDLPSPALGPAVAERLGPPGGAMGAGSCEPPSQPRRTRPGPDDSRAKAAVA
jgi:hypothetical protein